MEDGISKERTGLRVVAVLICVLALGGTVLEQEPVYVGGTTIVLGTSVEIAVPDGWHRGTPAMERDAEGFVLMYTGKNFDPGNGEPHGVVQINPEVDEFEDGSALDRFYGNVETNLVRSGWTRGELLLGGSALACYTMGEAGSTTFCVLIPFGTRSVTAYVIVPKAGAGFPKYAIRLLEAIRFK